MDEELHKEESGLYHADGRPVYLPTGKGRPAAPANVKAVSGGRLMLSARLMRLLGMPETIGLYIVCGRLVIEAGGEIPVTRSGYASCAYAARIIRMVGLEIGAQLYVDRHEPGRVVMEAAG